MGAKKEKYIVYYCTMQSWETHDHLVICSRLTLHSYTEEA